MIEVTEDIAQKVLDVVDTGLCSGVGTPIPGEMCILAAKRYACGLSHGDEIDGLPIGSAVRAFDIALNDGPWSSNAARAKGMRALAIAEFGSDKLDQVEFARRLALATIREILPIVLRAAKLEEHASQCEEAITLEAGRIAAARVADADTYAAQAAQAAARSAARAALAVHVADPAATYAATAAATYAATAATAARSAAYAVDVIVDDNVILSTMAAIGVRILVEMGCEGARYLYLVDERGT